MLRLILALLCLTAPLAQAQGWSDPDPLPALYNVTGVASDDTLNIRRMPSGKSEKFDVLAHDATFVEVIALNETGRWGQINTGEAGMGWVSMAYMAPVENGTFVEWPHMRCSGSEAPWYFEFEQGAAAAYSYGYTDPVALSASAIRAGSEGFRGHGIAATSPTLTVTATFRQDICESTMIEMARGIRAVVVATGADGTAVHTGCCSLIAP